LVAKPQDPIVEVFALLLGSCRLWEQKFPQIVGFERSTAKVWKKASYQYRGDARSAPLQEKSRCNGFFCDERNTLTGNPEMTHGNAQSSHSHQND
jgi:hypothetical protein